MHSGTNLWGLKTQAGLLFLGDAQAEKEVHFLNWRVAFEVWTRAQSRKHKDEIYLSLSETHSIPQGCHSLPLTPHSTFGFIISQKTY